MRPRCCGLLRKEQHSNSTSMCCGFQARHGCAAWLLGFLLVGLTLNQIIYHRTSHGTSFTAFIYPDGQQNARPPDPSTGLHVCLLTADFRGHPQAGGTATAYDLLAAVLHRFEPSTIAKVTLLAITKNLTM